MVSISRITCAVRRRPRSFDISWKLIIDAKGSLQKVTLDSEGKVDPSIKPEPVEDLLVLSRDFGIDAERVRRDASRPPPQVTITQH